MVPDGGTPGRHGAPADADRGRSLRPGVATTIARTELRRSIRAGTDSLVQTAGLAVLALLFVLPFGAALTYGSYLLGDALTEGTVGSLPLPVEGLFRGGLGVAFLGIAVFATIRAAAGRTELDEPPFLLTSAPVPTVVTGQLLAEWLRLAAWFGLPVLAITGAVGVGAGSPLPPLSIALALVLTVGGAYPVGFAVGFAIRHLATVVEPIAHHRLAFGALAFVAYMAIVIGGWLDRITVAAYRTLQDSPLGWLGDVALVGLPGAFGSPLLAAGGVVVAAVAFGGSVVATTAIARRNWFVDPPRKEDDVVRHEAGESGRLASVLGAVARPSTATVATTVLRRARRHPLKLVYAAYPLFFGIGLVQTVLDLGYVPAWYVPLIGLYGVWAAGSLVTLNPIGDLGDAAPSTVLSGLSGDRFVRGHLLVGIPIGLVLASALTAAAAAASPLSTTRALAFVAIAAVGGVWAPLVAMGVGASAPRFDSVAVFRNATATLPSKRAFAAYSVALAVVAGSLAIVDAPGRADVVAQVVTFLLGTVLSLDVTLQGTWVLQAARGFVVLGAVAPVAGYYYAVRAFDEFRLS